MASKYCTSFDGTRIFYTISRKSGPCIVFLHGWPHNHTVWGKEIAYFTKKGYTTISVDLRGHGKSGKPAKLEDYSFHSFAKDINTILTQEKITKMVLVGHSFGGMVALSCYDLFPTTINALVLLDTIYENPIKHLPIVKHLKLTPLTTHVLKFILNNKRIQQKHFPYVDFSKLKDHSDFYYWLKGVEETPLKSVLACLDKMLEFNAKKVLQTIHVPTLIIEGEKDTKTSIKEVQKMADKIPTSQLVIIKGATHDTNIRNPDKVEKVMERFLEKI